MKVELKNDGGLIRKVPVGLSWTGFFFTGFTMMARGMIGKGLVYLMIVWCIQGMMMLAKGVIFLSAGAEASAATGAVYNLMLLIPNFVFLFKLNKWTTRHWLDHGYKPTGSGWSAWGPKMGIQIPEDLKVADSSLKPESKIRIKDVFGFVAAGLIVLILASSGGTSSSTQSIESDNDTAAAPSAETEQKIPGLNEAVRVGHMEWTLTGVKKARRFSSELSEVTAGSDETILVWVSGKVTNRSTEEDTTLGGNLYLTDDQDTKYGESEEGAMVAEPLALDSFNPNVPKKFSTIFEVPLSAKGLKFMATDFATFSEETALIDLGLDQ